MFKRAWRSVSVVLVLLSAEVWGCGPDFPNSAILGGDGFLREMPQFSFAEGIERLRPPLPAEFKAIEPGEGQWAYRYNDSYHKQTADADVNDLCAAIGQSPLPGRGKRLLDSYKAARKAILDYRMACAAWEWRGSCSGMNGVPEFKAPEIPQGLLAEFAMYMQGAINYYKGDIAAARDSWKAVLKLREEDRRYRSTWAAFMIGKTLLEDDDQEAIEWFQRVRKIAADGFADSIGLAAASIGWEAKANLNLGRYEKAIELYVAQLAAGDSSAMASLRVASRMALAAEPRKLRSAAKNTTSRRVVTAYVLSAQPWWEEAKTEEMELWVTAIEEVGVKVAEEGDRLAWAAYGAGKMDLAQRWASAADEGSTLTRWVKSRLHLRAGRVREAAEELAKITFKLAPAEKRLEWNEEYRDEVSEHIQAELGVLRLGQREYVEALGLFLRAGLGEDAGYIAERVLTIEELKDYVDKRCDEAAAGQWQSETIRYILARRLARLGRCDEAVTYYPECWRKTFQAFTAFMENSRNRALGKHDRAENLWQAARITRYEGMELFGTEVEPDWHAWGGDYATMAYAYYRSAAESNEVTAATSDEKERIQRHVVEPAMRFHYRYIAAEMAWEAAELMPDNSDQTARVLCVAGSWLKNQDPNYADTFYKALVRRCSKTQLGREADARRWFPAIEDDWPASVNSHRPNRTSGEGT